jgi:FkbM family methyltransferase
LNRVAAAGQTLAFILGHPANRRRKVRALLTFAGWQLWKRTTGRSVITTFWSGLRVRVHPDSKSASLALYTRLPEYDDMLFTARALRPGDLVVDVGANVGLYTLIAASRVDPGRVIALEPDPLAASRLEANVMLNGLRNVDVRLAAAGAEAGEARLTTGLDTTNHIVSDESAPSIPVRLVTLDEVVGPTADVALVKLDAEGFESQVLAGSERMLRERRVAAWIVEVNGLGSRYGAGDATLLEKFDLAGYRPFRYHADRNVLESSRRPDLEKDWNLIFARDGAELSRRLLSRA